MGYSQWGAIGNWPLVIRQLRTAGRAAILFGLLSFGGCKEPGVSVTSEELPDQVIYDFLLHESASGSRLYTLTAKQAAVLEKQDRIEVLAPRVEFYDDEGRVYSRLTAEQGTVFIRKQNLVGRGNVVVQTAESTALFTDSLVWDNSRRLILTESQVEIRSPKGRVFGQGLTADAGLNRIEILSEVRGSSAYEFAP